VPREAGAAALRLLERLGDTPVFLCDAAWNAVAVNTAWTALGAAAPTGHAWDWNVAWRTFCNPLRAISRTAEDATDFEAVLAARLQSASLRYPDDAALAALADGLRSASRTFDALWRAPRAVATAENRAVFRHPDVGDVALDGNILAVPGDDLVAVVLTASPGSPDAARLGELVGGAGEPAVVRVGQVGPG
jgi:hypothetical protein